MRVQQLLLTNNWQFKQDNRFTSVDQRVPDWLPASVPGTVHQDLLAANAIPDPFIGRNELEVQWVGEVDWLYRCSFDLPVAWLEVPSIDLCCEGLDTFATMWLNGTQISATDNMFVPQRVPVASLLHEGVNTLEILFESALRRGREREECYGKRTVWGSDASRAYVRKAQYHYGWDWGPTLLTAGAWRPVRLEAYSVRIEGVSCHSEVAADLSSAILPVYVQLEHAPEGNTQELVLHMQLYDSKQVLLDEAILDVDGVELAHYFTLGKPHLWWPRGYGDQPLYRIVVSLRSGDDNEIDQRTLRIGMRRVQLLQHPLPEEAGTSFVFAINNTPIFCAGANWIPADSFMPRVSPEQYRRWLQLAADANMVMLRVWGGGIYEEDLFYDLCDELGLLVWQDFMFACALYPVLDWFQESVGQEIEATLRRLRHHPSIALWCGNNEDYMHPGNLGLYDRTEEIVSSRIPARLFYEQLMPQLCARLDPTRPYWPGSPYGGADANDARQGDQHMWSVWHHPMANYHEYARFHGRFISEFGMQAYPAVATIEGFAPLTERYAQSRTLDHHNKGDDGPRRLVAYLNDTLRIPDSLEAYVYATQFVQAEALATAIRSWRRRWQGPGREYSAGSLIWQLNDCWPVISWAIVDSCLRPKPAYYVVRREFAAATIGLMRHNEHEAALWAVNGTLRPREARLIISEWTLEGVHIHTHERNAMLASNQSTELGTIAIQSSHVLHVQWVENEHVVTRATLWPEPFKYTTFPDPSIYIHRLDEQHIQISVQKPAKGIWLGAHDEVRWSDNMLDLVPGDTPILEVHGLGKGDEISIQWVK